MAQWLSTLATFAEDVGSVPSTNMAHNPLPTGSNSSFRRFDTLLLASQGALHAHGMHTCRQNTHTENNVFKNTTK